MIIVDAHLDLAWNALDWNRDLRLPVAEIRRREQEQGLTTKGRGCNTVSLPELRRGKVAVCVATLLARLLRPNLMPAIQRYEAMEAAYAAAYGQLAYYRALEQQGWLRWIKDGPTLEAHVRAWQADEDGDEPLGFILSMEGADPVLAPEQVEEWWQAGLRIIGPAHYGVSPYAHGTGTDGGLFPPGPALLKEMERVGMILDVTHLSDQCFDEALGAGSHDFKIGTQFSWERMAYDRIRNGDILLELEDGIARRAFLSNTPINSDHRLETWAFFAQDRWSIGRATINAGLRIDGVQAALPAQSSPAGTWVGERSFPAREVFNFSADVAPRIGISYDLTGNGRTALKAYYGRFYNQFGSELAESGNQNALVSLQVPWSDPNGNLRVDPGELDLSGFTGFAASLFPPIDPDAKRPYSDEINVGVDHQLLRDLAVSVSYHRRQHRDGLTILDRARPTSAYSPIQRTYNDPQRGSQTITVFNLNPALRLIRDRIITNVDLLQSDYDGVIFSVNKRLSNRWQLLAGLTLQSHQGFAHSGTFTDTGANNDFNNPNYQLNRADSAVFTDIPWAFTLSGSYQLPYEIVISGKYTARDGDPLNRTLNVGGLTQGTDTVWVQPRGDDRTETVSKFVDIRFAKRFTVGIARFEGTIDVFNLLNANHVLLQTEAIGSAIGRPSRILAPRIIRFGITTRF